MEKCQECGIELSENIHIFIMKKQRYNLRYNRGFSEEVVCSNCRHDIDWSEGWGDDEDEEPN